ncbi:hypothetical protein FQR65_LT11755, partial [Abscondita terminalis]
NELDFEARTTGWSDWSEWAPCSRSCDGGVTHQFRKCQLSRCRGDHIRYKICNMQPCPVYRDFREDQCAAFNNVPYQGSLFQWSAEYDERNPCALTCRGKAPIGNNLEGNEPLVVIAQLNDKVEDGTRCRQGSLDMCIDGKCQRVGCDLRIGSALQVDSCGNCGGDGSSCAQPLYHWALKSVSLCSVTCGGGYKMSRPVCQNILSGIEVEEQLCNDSMKPDAAVVECNIHNCPPKWHTTDWGSCSVSCGGGSRLRQVYCVEETRNKTKIKIGEQKCPGRKPRYQEPCNQMICPKWQASPWSGCSVSCGEGVQVRVVECRNADDLPSTLCSNMNKPTTTKSCSTGIQCPQFFDSAEELLPGLYHTQPLIQPYPPPPPAHAEKLIGEHVIPSESTFITDEWGPCSVSCGDGIRKREVHCKIFLEFSRTIAKLPDAQCNGPKPIATERCFMEPCSSERIDIKDDPFRSDIPIKVGSGSPGTTYSWKEQGYTHCSASCLGGVQESIVNCVRDDTQKVTSPYMCPREFKPEVLVRTCNDHPCPPRWNYSDFQPCTQSCGIGIQTREVTCIHEVTQGGGNTVVVPSNMCPQPPPPDRQNCNVLDCPVRWKVSEWSKCSKNCDGGEKSRKVECKQVMAQNHTVDRPMSMCPSPKPPDKKPCNTKSCVLETDKPQIDVSNSTFIQHDPKKKKVSLKVGGAATVFYGSMIKIKCPVKRFNRTKIQWVKDQNYLPKTKKYKVSKKGALRILNLNYKDRGVYTCIAGKSTADLVLSIKPRPGEFPTSEEIQKQIGYKNSHRIDFEISDVQAGRDEMNPVFGNDDHSHEQRPDMPKKNPTPRTRIILPTLTPRKINLNVSNLNAIPPHSTTLVSEDEQGRVVPSHFPVSSDSLKPAASSSGSRVIPHFQQLISNIQHLWPFQTLTNTRGYRMVATYSDNHVLDDTLDSVESTTEEDDYGSITILGKGTPDNIKFTWSTGDWSKCSQTCGENGFQMRTVQCMIVLHNTSQPVESHFCEDSAASIPENIQKCELEECPKWSVSSWSPCETSKCLTLNTAIQRRKVTCLNYKNVTVDAVYCSNSEKPPHRQECFKDKCKGVWKVGAWSKCTAACDVHGVKYRILQCVWFGTKRPAGTTCQDQIRPPVMKSCKGPPCSIENNQEECNDHSKFCDNVKAMDLCKILKYQHQCCYTCKAL